MSSRADTEDPDEAGKTAWFYWTYVVAIVILSAIGISLSLSWPAEAVPFVILLGFPLIQLNASLLTLLTSVFTPIDLRRLGRITWKGFVWALVGFLLMLAPILGAGAFGD